jgi:predicted signal transduction protein with EAL and GGDEF domain
LNYRTKIKEIKKRSEELHELIKKHTAADDKLKKAKANAKPTDALEREEKDLLKQVQEMEAINERLKRAALKEAMMIQYQGWADFAVKVSQLAHFGKHMAAQVPQGSVGPGESLPPYTGFFH